MTKPKQIGKYELLEELGRGGFSTVYKAHDPALDRTVALKVLLPYWTQDPTFETRFRREARAAANLRHPNIVTVHDAGEADGDLYIAMEYLPGRTLHQLLEEGALTIEQTLPILEQLAAALDYAHGRGIVHRDVKPNNVIVEETGRGVHVTLMDFGLVKALSGSSVLTSQGTLLGSPEYMAPEQADPARVNEIGPTTDRYALGVVAYQMLAGRVPFPGNTPATLNAHLNLPPPAPCDLNPQLPPQVEQVLLKALAKKPADRYQSAGELARALKQAVEAEARARQRQEQVAEYYEKLQQAIENQDWLAAESHCREIMALEPDYQDVPELWTQVRETRARQRQLEKLYAQAQSQAKSASWADVQTLCQQIEALEPGYRDTTQLLAQAGEKLREAQAQQERETRLAQLYEQARAALQRERWQEVRQRCADVEALQPGYRDVDALLDQAEQGLRREQARQETEKERHARLAQLYTQLQTAVGKKDWAQVLTLGGQIQALEPTYRDVSDRIAQAREQLHRPQSRVPIPTWGWWAGAALLILLVLLCIAATLGPQLWESIQVNIAPNTPISKSTHTLTPVVTPVIIREPVGDVGTETEGLLETTEVPVRDLHDLAIRLRGLPPNTLRTINPGNSPDYPVGARRLFHASDVDTDEQFDVYAILEYKTEHVYMWIEEGVRYNQSDLKAAADLFEEHTYSTDRTFFGSEWNPGVDNDPHLSILHARGLGNTVAGYYSSADEFVSAVRDDSNEMEMFYINIENVTLNDSFYNGMLAHEFQHMIHWHNDRNEEPWLNEGLSELAMYLNGFDVGGFERTFAGTPDMQLNSWPEGPGAAGANYGAGYLFTSYFLDRFGPEATQALVAHPDNSFASVEAVMGKLGIGLTYEDLFADWIVANQLDDPNLADGRYGYEEINPPSFEIETTYYESDYPVSTSGTVHQHGTDYIELHNERPLVLRFIGSTQIVLVNTTAHSGGYVWWSNRGDDSDMMLTRAFDLSDVSEATLEFWAWYDIEEDWDYAYVEISTDGGETWEILTTPSGTPTNPNGNSFGWAYTGKSGGKGTAEWIQEQIDISLYTRQEVLIRFEYITDSAVNRPGFVLDDIAIPEIDYSSDFEEDENEWKPAGFIRHANVLPQRWLVQMILFGPETTVERLELTEDQIGEWVVSLNSSTDRAIFTISGLAPVTTELGSYSYEIEER